MSTCNGVNDEHLRFVGDISITGLRQVHHINSGAILHG